MVFVCVRIDVDRLFHSILLIYLRYDSFISLMTSPFLSLRCLDDSLTPCYDDSLFMTGYILALHTPSRLIIYDSSYILSTASSACI